MKRIVIVLLVFFTSFTTFLKVNAEVDPEFAYNDQKIVFVGDSITAAENVTEAERWTTIVGSELGFESVVNIGMPSALYQRKEGSTNSIVQNYDDVPVDADVIVLLAGVNDWNAGDLFGANDSVDDTTFMGALNIVLDGLQTNHPTAEIIVMTPYKVVVVGEGNKSYTVANANSTKNLGEYAEAIVTASALRDISYIDLFNVMGFDPALSENDKTRFTTDGVHLTVDGNRRLANIVISFLQKNITTIYTDNLFTTQGATTGSYLVVGGGSATASTFSYTDYIPVVVGRSYVFYTLGAEGGFINFIGEYVDIDLTRIGYESFEVDEAVLDKIITIPEGTEFVRLNYFTANASNVYLREIYNYDITVSFETYGDTSLDSIIVQKNDTLVIPIPTRTGYTFSGWHVDEALTLAFASNTPITEDITLYAKWTQTGGGTVTPPETEASSTTMYIVIGGLVVLVALAALTPKKKKG